MPGGQQTDVESVWVLVALTRVHGPVPFNMPLTLLRGKTTKEAWVDLLLPAVGELGRGTS